MRKQLGLKTDAASATGSINGKLNYMLTSREIASASNNLKISSDTERTTTSTLWATKKSILIGYTGIIRVSYDLKGSPGADATAYCSDGAEHIQGDTYATFSEDIWVDAGDHVNLYVKAGAGGTAYVRNFRIYYDLTTSTDKNIVILD